MSDSVYVGRHLITDEKGRDTPMNTPVPPEDTRQAQQRITARLAEIDFALPGTITERMTRCGKHNCACRTDPDTRHGPYIQWTRTINGKTVTKMLSRDQLTRYQSWFDNHHQLRDLVTELEANSIKTISHAEGWGS